MSIKKLLSMLLSRMTIAVLLVVVQVGFSLFIIAYLSSKAVPIYFFFVLLSFVVVLWINSREDNPTYKLAWIVPIMLVPVFGGLFYLLWGKKTMPKKDRRRMEEYYSTRPELFARQDGHEQQLAEESPQLARLADYLFNTSGFPLENHTTSEYYPLGDDVFQPMMEELRRAKRFILLEYFIIDQGLMWDSILEILKEKAAQGVEVLLIYDDMGCLFTLPLGYDQALGRWGIRVQVFNPFRAKLTPAMNYRDHRKICVVDGNVGFCGGINLADEYINAVEKHGHWKDTVVRLEGEGVWNLTLMFFQIWHYLDQDAGYCLDHYRPTVQMPSDGFVQPYGDSPLDNLNVAESGYLHLINRATRYVYITTPYLILDNEVTTALILAAQSGIDVRIVTPYVPDKWYVHAVTRSTYPRLTRAGVKIYEYLPGFIHAKMIVADDDVAMVGTTNMDYRSFYLHFECGVFFYKGTMVEKVRRDMEATFAVSRQITTEMAQDVPLFTRLVRIVLELFAPMM